MDRGVVVGSDARLEWLLPWWWERYHHFCDLPVVFVDFGMTKTARSFCEERGYVISLPEMDPSVFSCDDPSWGQCYGASYDAVRQGWFKKPLALIASPFEISLWLDLDCEVLDNLMPLFSYAKEGPFIALVKEVHAPDKPPYTVYNGGVILYRKNTPIIERFAHDTFKRAKEFWGDDRLLSSLIDEMNCPVIEMDPICNWRYGQGIPAKAFILHWSGDWGKRYIKEFGGVFPFLK